MNIVLFIIAWIILGIIATCIVSKVAKQYISEIMNNAEVDNETFVSAVNEKAEDNQKLTGMLAHTALLCIIGIILWPVAMPLALYGWKHFNEL